MPGKILIVDDDRAMRRILRTMLSSYYTLQDVESGEAALEVAADWHPDLVLLDLGLPGIDGFETCRRLKAELPVAPQVSIVSGKSARSEMEKAFAAGADDYLVKPVDPCELRSRVRLHLRLRNALHRSESGDDSSSHRHDFNARTAVEQSRAIFAIQDVAVFLLAKVAEARDNETGEHLIRMRDYSLIMAQDLQRCATHTDTIDSIFLADLYRSAPLHDIGKVGIPDDILLKPGQLTPAEFEIMKQHTVIGANILDQAVTQTGAGGFLAMAASIARYHHERWDGGGYPNGLAGEQIPLPARIVAVADVYDALTSDRPYKPAWLPQRAYATIVKGCGSQFDPEIVAAFERCFDEFQQTQQRHAAQAVVPLGTTPTFDAVLSPATMPG